MGSIHGYVCVHVSTLVASHVAKQQDGEGTAELLSDSLADRCSSNSMFSWPFERQRQHARLLLSLCFWLSRCFAVLAAHRSVTTGALITAPAQTSDHQSLYHDLFCLLYKLLLLLIPDLSNLVEVTC